jgi:autotransporter translocation and assembly factor TamB
MREVVRPPLRLRVVRAESVDWLRLPHTTSNAQPARIFNLRLPRVEVTHLRPASNLVAGATLDLRVRAGLERNAAGWWVLLDANDAGTEASLSAVLRTASPMALTVRIHEPRGGVCSQRLRQGDAGLRLDVWAERTHDAWQGSVRANTPERELQLAWSHPAAGVWEADATARNVVVPMRGQALEVEAARVRWRQDERRGRFQVSARYAGEPLWAEGALVRRADGISLPNLLITAEGLRVRLYAQREAAWSADARFSFSRGGALARWLPPGWDADGRGTFSWRGDAFQLRTFLPRVEGPGALRLNDVEAQAYRGGDGVLRFDGGLADLQRGATSFLTQLHVKGQAQAVSAGWQVTLEKASAQRGDIPLELRAPFEIASASNALRWTRSAWSVGAGGLACEGRWADDLAVDLTWSNFSPRLLAPLVSPEISGRLGGRVSVRGTPASPQLDAAVTAQDLRFYQSAATLALAPAEVQADLKVAENRAIVGIVATGWTDEPLRMTGDLPVRWSMRPWRLDFPRDEPGRGSLRGVFDLARLERIMDLHGARVRGGVEGELTIAGTRDQPVVQGRVVVSQGSLTLPASGASLRDIRVVMEGDDRRLTIREATARDHGTGRVEMGGHLLFDPDQKFPLALRLQLEQMELWRQGRSRAVVNGELEARGDLARINLTGQITAPVVEIQLAAPRPPVKALPVTGLPAIQRPEAKAEPASRWGERVHLAVDLKARPGAVVRGRGLESLWRVDLNAGGTVAHPVISGGIQARRGYFLFMGRRFDLESGWLTLDGRHPPQPGVDVVATTRASDLQARLQISGSAREPVLALTSDPPYPTDEILARLLFGKSADSISAFQAISLAHGLTVLRGRGSALDVLNRGQSLLKVDQLDLRQDQEQGTISSVAVGKYIGRSVFVQGATALDGSGDVISVEVDLAPSLTLQTETSPGIREGIGLRWRRDY